jgi:hypothetical protein
MDARGKFGDALVFTAWKGRQVVRQLVTPGNPMTTAQVDARNKIRVTGAAQKQVNASTQKQSGKTLTDEQLLRAAAPSGQAWNGYLSKIMIGVGDAMYTAGEAAWTALTSGNKTTWDTAAAARTPAFLSVAQKIANNAAGTTKTAGEVYFLQQYGMYGAGLLPIPVAATPPTYA